MSYLSVYHVILIFKTVIHCIYGLSLVLQQFYLLHIDASAICVII